MPEFPTRQLICLLFSIIPYWVLSQVELSDGIRPGESFEEWVEMANRVRLESPDSAIRLYQRSYEHFLEQKDTLNAVNSLVEMAVVYGHIARYQSAYDNLWKALLLADLAQNERAKIPVYINLGRYYSFYKRKENALAYFQRALALSKALLAKGQLSEQELVSCYYALCSTYRELDDPANAQIYLDSCWMYYDPTQDPATAYYLKFESAFIACKSGKYQQALDQLFSIQPWFEQNSPGFQVLLFTHIGDVYLLMEKPREAETYYKKALTASATYQSHLDFTPTIYERLSKLYLERGDFPLAYNSLQKMKELDQQYFDSRSANNRSLLEIKDEFRLEKEKQRQLIQQQRLMELEHEERVAFLKNVILVVTLVFLSLVGIIYFNYVRNKHKAEKELIRKKKELEVKQARELVELKNRELAASSLKLIEKDEILAALKEKLSEGNGEIKASELKKLVRTISHSRAQNWEEFEAIFISVNKEFYNKLNKHYPKLSRGDQKLCALIKLNLSSKEIAKLLGISTESVHTNRYRLRKKLKLSRDTSLTEFLARF
ncbi:MAG: helix-turn-helix transcriptional regulator [Bacteroidetes bacterium]|nr:MAG: helix-turn-helix transcriptional regulator [Bacteroidota bacterium]